MTDIDHSPRIPSSTRSETTLSAEVRALVESEDLELGALSDEEHEALFFAEMVAVNPKARPAMEAATRALIAHELATLADDGTVTYGGMANLVRRAVVTATAAFQLTGTVEGTRANVTVRSLDGDLTLTERREFPGIRRYELGRARRIRRALVQQLTGSKAPSGGTTEQFEVPNDDPRLAELKAGATTDVQITASRDFDGETRIIFACSVIRDPTGQTWVITRGEAGTGTTLAKPYAAEELAELLTAWIGPAPSTAS